MIERGMNKQHKCRHLIQGKIQKVYYENEEKRTTRSGSKRIDNKESPRAPPGFKQLMYHSDSLLPWKKNIILFLTLFSFRFYGSSSKNEEETMATGWELVQNALHQVIMVECQPTQTPTVPRQNCAHYARTTCARAIMFHDFAKIFGRVSRHHKNRTSRSFSLIYQVLELQ